VDTARNKSKYGMYTIMIMRQSRMTKAMYNFNYDNPFAQMGKLEPNAVKLIQQVNLVL